jgi:hypothetical protein
MPTVRKAKPKVPEIALTVEWDPGRERYVVFNSERQVSGLSPEPNTAIGAGLREANRLSAEGFRVVVMVKDRNDGKLRREYVAEPAKSDPGEIKYRKQSRWRR